MSRLNRWNEKLMISNSSSSKIKRNLKRIFWIFLVINFQLKGIIKQKRLKKKRMIKYSKKKRIKFLLKKRKNYQMI